MTRIFLLASLGLLAVAISGDAWAQSEKNTKKPEAAKKAEPTKKSESKAAAKKPAANGSAANPSAGATLVETFGDWKTYVATTGRSKLCFAQTEPKSRSPGSLKETKAYLFVSFRPADNIRNELATVLNFKPKEDAPATMSIGTTNFDLVTKGENAWVKNQADEASAIATMAKGGTLTLQTTSARGNKTSDRYSLTGFGQALDRAKRDCP